MIKLPGNSNRRSNAIIHRARALAFNLRISQRFAAPYIYGESRPGLFLDVGTRHEGGLNSAGLSLAEKTRRVRSPAGSVVTGVAVRNTQPRHCHDSAQGLMAGYLA